jgi:hypothetical protein
VSSKPGRLQTTSYRPLGSSSGIPAFSIAQGILSSTSFIVYISPSSSLSLLAVFALLLGLVTEDVAPSAAAVVATTVSPFPPSSPYSFSPIPVARGSFNPFAYFPMATVAPKIVAISP